MADGSPPLYDARPHAVVIGSGFGGLAAAIRLGARGFRVTVLERLDQAGGRARTHRDRGFVFDAGPTIVTAPFLFEELWTLVGARMEDDVALAPVDPFYRIRFHDGSSFDVTADPDGMREAVRRLSPGDVEGYERFLVFARELCRVGFEELGAKPFSSWTDMAKLAPDLIRLKAYRSVHALVAGFVKDERLRQALSFHPLFIGGDPFRASSLYALIAWLERRWGVHYALGGMGRLVAGLCRLVRAQGGSLRFGADVERILVENGRAAGVALEGGETIRADVVVSNADAAVTYGRLLSGAPRRRWTDGRLKRASYSMSLFVWHFGVRRTYPDVPHHLILMGPRYRGLLEDVFRNKRLAEDFSLYLHRPTATDPTLAPEGCDAFYVLSPVPNLLGDVDWETQAEPYRRKIERFLEETVLPGFASEVVVSRVTTPLTFRDDFQSLHGAAFGLEPVLTQSAWFRPHNASEEVENLFLVGAGVHPGAGLPGVLCSAKILDQVVPNARSFVR